MILLLRPVYHTSHLYPPTIDKGRNRFIWLLSIGLQLSSRYINVGTESKPSQKLMNHILPIWGIDIIGKISLKYSSGHEFILVAIDYFTKSHTLLFGIWYGGSAISRDRDGFIEGSIRAIDSQGRLGSGSIRSAQSPR
ncbi:hypothetical protein CK203_034641 [Vitis vinifera]|uniref:Uncharacterized protein n=1 Tax=Vitis vinifera TaxID=29760 RepID=A0A438HWI7_VITVI|nr:hypothetical protein CK203_034641 [Vitis vinifera]